MKTIDASAYFALLCLSHDMVLTKVSPLVVSELRAELKKPIVREMLLESARISRRAAPLYQIHHEIPLSLGGTNDIKNLVLCRDRVHCLIHVVIGNQPWLKIGHSGVVKVPLCPSKKNRVIDYYTLKPYWIN